ncbi:bifunctional riboflavin kinase/FAD synthetase [Polycyclovorans algicola]|uniref:bifunctional riboflavin kinase/FAD synthetase n=1 Tax=Polycyclovorans algicola TaxID=616992 RepID=UPI0004A72D1D|nr:bifunctional riboflavin kinase/FAD synthetase [Polycyclovorans algicola]
MKLVRGQHNAAALNRPCVVTIGNFDGVHRGHQALIATARREADARGLPVTLLTFEPTPLEVFAPASAPHRVTTLRTKLRDLAAYGVDQVLVQRFDARFAATSPDAFVTELLVRDLCARAVVVGDDFHFGKARGGDFSLLTEMGQRLGFTTHALGTVAAGTLRVSSTAVRKALAAADLPGAAELLGRPYRLTGRVRHGLHLGRTLDMPTANLPVYRPLALRHGVYCVELKCGDRVLPAVANYGVRPTLGGTPALLEVHCLDNPGDLYGAEVDVTFLKALRDELRFDSLDALKAQMQADRTAAQAFFSYP